METNKNANKQIKRNSIYIDTYCTSNQLLKTIQIFKSQGRRSFVTWLNKHKHKHMALTGAKLSDEMSSLHFYKGWLGIIPQGFLFGSSISVRPTPKLDESVSASVRPSEPRKMLVYFVQTRPTRIFRQTRNFRRTRLFRRTSIFRRTKKSRPNDSFHDFSQLDFR